MACAIRGYTKKRRMIKKEYIKPAIVVEEVLLESMLATSNSSEGMGSNETPGTDDDFNAPGRRGSWGNLWE